MKMDLIYGIIALLLVTPILLVCTDLSSGKIKNYFVVPLIFASFLLTFFIEGFFIDKDNIIGLIICTVFGFFFYINNKWGAGDGKYIILLGLNTIIIQYLLGYKGGVNYLFIFTFGILFFTSVLHLILSYKKIKKISFDNLIPKDYLNSFFLIAVIFLFSVMISYFLGGEYRYITIFLSIFLLAPYVNKINNKYFRIFILSLAFGVVVYFNFYISFVIIFFLFYIFSILQRIIDIIYSIIDIKEQKIFDLNQGDILTQGSIAIILRDTGIEYSESPLQGNEIFDIIGFYKGKKNNIMIKIHNDIKIGVYMYFGFLLGFIYCIIYK